MAQFRQRSAKIHGRGRFADTAFLVSDRDDFHLGLRIISTLGVCQMMLLCAANEN